MNRNFIKILNDFKSKKDNFFIQIGANDGLMEDPIFKTIKEDNWSGIMFEPVPSIFKKLIENHKKFNVKNITYENLAVSDVNEKKVMHLIPEDVILKNNFPKTLSGCNTFHDKRMGDTDIPMKIFIEKYKSHVVQQEVQCITMRSYFENKNFKRSIDMLVIDAEGHDLIIVNNFPFDQFKPKVILFETCVNKKVYSDKDLKITRNLLENEGYSVDMTGYNTLAVLNE